MVWNGHIVGMVWNGHGRPKLGHADGVAIVIPERAHGDLSGVSDTVSGVSDTVGVGLVVGPAVGPGDDGEGDGPVPDLFLGRGQEEVEAVAQHQEDGHGIPKGAPSLQGCLQTKSYQNHNY